MFEMRLVVIWRGNGIQTPCASNQIRHLSDTPEKKIQQRQKTQNVHQVFSKPVRMKTREKDRRVWSGMGFIGLSPDPPLVPPPHFEGFGFCSLTWCLSSSVVVSLC